jgi:Lon protease-like protein
MSGEDARALPIFELPIVLLPGERTALHIFEERYQRMVGRSLEAAEPFGIVFHDEDGARAVGCTAVIDEVLERFDDGRLNIAVRGEAPFRVLDRFEAPDYPAGEVEVIAEPQEPGDDTEAAAQTRESFAALAERATGERPDEAELETAGAYAIAARIELPEETKQALLEQRDEDERMRTLARVLEAAAKALERAEQMAERASSNGKVRTGQTET